MNFIFKFKNIFHLDTLSVNGASLRLRCPWEIQHTIFVQVNSDNILQMPVWGNF